MMPRAALLVVAAFAGVVSAQAPPPIARTDRDPAGLVTETKHLAISVSSSVRAAAPGAPLSLFVHITPKAKMHVYAPDQQDYIPVSLTLTSDPAFRAGAARFPPAERYFFAPLKETQRVYSKPFRITQPVTLTPAAAGPVTIKAVVRYQACDDAICYVPQQVPVSWTIDVRR